jgi:hypothetical protein
LNDLWKFNPSTDEWTWMGGNSTPGDVGQPGVYGTLGEPAAGNFPGSRYYVANWIDSDGAFWLFGGNGQDANNTGGSLNDLWKFQPAAVLTSPAPTSTLSGPSVTFHWTTASGATGYSFRLGTTVGGYNIYGSGPTTATSVTVSNLPTNGEAIYATLYTTYGSAQVLTHYTFTATTQAALTSPAGGTVLTGPSVTFHWTTAAGATGYRFLLGTTAGSNNLYGSGTVTATSAAATGLPTNGETIYATLYTAYDSVQVDTDYTFTAATPAALTSPAAGTVLAGPTVTFNWTTAPGATGYRFLLGTTQGANNLYGSGTVTATSVTAYGLPTNGETIYATLYTTYSSVQLYSDYTFTGATPAALTSPTAGTVLAGPSVTFNWTTAPGATGYRFLLGTTKGANNLYGSGTITATSTTATRLPTNGETIYARLYTTYGSVQVYTDYTFTTSTGP